MKEMLKTRIGTYCFVFGCIVGWIWGLLTILFVL